MGSGGGSAHSIRREPLPRSVPRRVAKVYAFQPEDGIESSRSPLDLAARRMKNPQHIEAAERSRFMLLLDPVLPGLWRTALRLTRQRHGAEDLVQTATLKALRFFATYTEGTNFKAWMYRVLYTTHVNQRRDSDPVATPLIEGIEPQGAANAMLRDLERPTHAERSAAVLEAVDDQIRAAVDSLPEHLRIVFLLSTVEDLKYREIAAVLDCPIGTVMSRLFRAREMLQEQLAVHARSLGWIQAPLQREAEA
ncbi:MAG: sigma-70 family RNA polymerase sigma factor [Planctomycetes bacterium]|nr:sigma-70 family RNA polymerase sigma factor [Planctomycetota bacterium]